MKTLLSEDELLALAYPTVQLKHDECDRCEGLVGSARMMAHIRGSANGSAFYFPDDGGHSATVRRVPLSEPPVDLLDSDEYDDRLTRLRIVMELNNDGPSWMVDGINTATLPWRLSLEVECYDTFERAVAAVQSFCDRNGYTLMPPSCQRGAHTFDDAGGDTCMLCGYVFDDSDQADD